MIALYRADRQAEALQAFRAARAALRRGSGDRAGRAPARARASRSSSRRRSSLPPRFEPEPLLAAEALPRALQFPAGCPVHRPRERAGAAARAAGSQVSGGACMPPWWRGRPGSARRGSRPSSPAPCSERPGNVLYGRCDDGLAVPFQPFVEALRPVAGDELFRPPGRARRSGTRAQSGSRSFAAVGDARRSHDARTRPDCSSSTTFTGRTPSTLAAPAPSDPARPGRRAR